MSLRDKIGNRMKEYYENIPKTKLMRRAPVAVRVDGKSFHTFTHDFEKPFDKILMKSMQQTMEYMCENIQGCVFGYTQSDEITLILQDYATFETQPWFNYEVQKLCSISASMATLAFNRFFIDNVHEFSNHDKYDTYINAIRKGAMFDARCFNIPKEEVTNLIYWRQLDATRNSIQMVGQANFAHWELQNKSCDQIQDMLHERKGINWNNFPTDCKRGTACRKVKKEINIAGNPEVFEVWEIDHETPIFKDDDREYIEKLVNF